MTRPEGAVWSSCGIATLPQPKRKQLVIVLFLKGGGGGGGGGEGHVMPAVSEAKQKDTPTQVITLDGEVHSGPKSQQPSPEPEFIITRVRQPARFQDFVHN